MSLNVARIRQALQNFDFKTLFTQELGWDKHSAHLPLAVDGKTFILHAVAEKRGMQVFECAAPNGDGFPEYDVRRKIERQVAKLAHEHIIIYTDAGKTVQKWQWVRREAGRPLACREPGFQRGQTGEALAQKLQLLAVALEEEEQLGIVEVAGKAKKAFDVDRVTKKFYDRFKTEHAKFLGFIKGITGKGDREWYASLMLNRLMFIYFIQKKGFLDNDTDYLRNRLRQIQERKGKDKFLTFYQYFLVRLFHEGLGKPKGERQWKKDLETLIGDVPYLNGGLFDVHQLEKANPEIQITDDAFERLFDFFDAYQWHLDDRSTGKDDEINPEVLGYIFEKYINQKQMGAYYTKEDITGYIARNTIIPFLFNAAEKDCDIAFRSDSVVWRLLSDNPDRYIYPAMLTGVDTPLPSAIADGLTDVSKRKLWNGPAPAEVALPTETWREHVARRQRCLDIRTKLKAGEVHDINDLITLNLDICQFAEDVIENCEGSDLLLAFWKAIQTVSVLDPTCGSGAFLFAALNVLEPLYEACLERMSGFLEDLEQSKRKHHPATYDVFRKVLHEASDTKRHPGHRYFVRKSIVLNNLYGVDIMEEAVEICKLRLFLNLVAQVESSKHVEPLPDIDFNIRPGNTLVGFANLDEVRRSLLKPVNKNEAYVTMPGMGESEEVQEIITAAKYVDDAFCMFHEVQSVMGLSGSALTKKKQDLRQKLDDLDAKLDHYLSGEYGVDPKKPGFATWKTSHQPFHWFAEFYGIMSRGGFDVIIGNPPWIEYAKVKKDYTIKNYRTESCGNLHAACTERGIQIRSPFGYLSFIVQLPLVSSSRMVIARQVLKESSANLHVIPFGDRPGKLFDGLEHSRATIWMSGRQRDVNDRDSRFATSRYQRWPTETRPFLFDTFEYASSNGKKNDVQLYPDQFPKFANELAIRIIQKLTAYRDHTINELLAQRETRDFVFYQEATEYWVKATVGLPYYAKNGKVGAPAHGRYLYFPNSEHASLACALMHSSLFFLYFTTFSDCFHLSDGLVRAFPAAKTLIGEAKLPQLGTSLMEALRSSAERKTIQTKAGDKIAYDEYFGWKAKPTIDRIDTLLAKHYAFAPEELDFISNYDIKFRLGQDGYGEGDDE